MKQGREQEAGLSDTRSGQLTALASTHMDTKAQYEYAKLSDMAEVLFVPVKE